LRNLTTPKEYAVPDVLVRDAGEADLVVIATITTATGQHDEWGGANPAYVRHLMEHGRVVVAEYGAEVVGFGAVQQIGAGPASVSMLCDLFVDPVAHGHGSGRAILAELWSGARSKMTFSSLHAHAAPLYTSFGLDAWWPLLYLHGNTTRLPVPSEWAMDSVGASQVARFELDWTGTDRTANYRAWAGRPGAELIALRRGEEIIAAGAVMNSGPDRGIIHLALSPVIDDDTAATVVILTLARLGGRPADKAHLCLPAPHPAVRPLLAAGWRFSEFDLFMATSPDLLDPRRAVPSPGQA
jgi:GNAT superfamily N-acetyltransferase